VHAQRAMQSLEQGIRPRLLRPCSRQLSLRGNRTLVRFSRLTVPFSRVFVAHPPRQGRRCSSAMAQRLLGLEIDFGHRLPGIPAARSADSNRSHPPRAVPSRSRLQQRRSRQERDTVARQREHAAIARCPGAARRTERPLQLQQQSCSDRSLRNRPRRLSE
jgi:hypothetical protein